MADYGGLECREANWRWMESDESMGKERLGCQDVVSFAGCAFPSRTRVLTRSLPSIPRSSTV